jgi:hypothetical protein
MLGQLLEVEATTLRMTCRLIYLDNAVLQVNVHEVVGRRIGRPLDEAGLRSVHCLDHPLNPVCFGCL